MTYLEPSEAQVACFMVTQQDDQPVAMLNLLRYRERAAYAAGDEGEGDSGRQAYARYAALALPCIQEVGGEVVWQGQGRMTLVGPEDEAWDDMFIVHYPSPKSFLEMINNPEYQAIAFHRKAALVDSRLVALVPGAASFQRR